MGVEFPLTSAEIYHQIIEESWDRLIEFKTPLEKAITETNAVSIDINSRPYNSYTPKQIGFRLKGDTYWIIRQPNGKVIAIQEQGQEYDFGTTPEEFMESLEKLAEEQGKTLDDIIFQF